MTRIDPKDVLRTARKLVKRGDFAGALEKYLWIHWHAVEYDVLFHGIRLFYALYEWLDLGVTYASRIFLICVKQIRESYWCAKLRTAASSMRDEQEYNWRNPKKVESLSEGQSISLR